MGGSGFRFRFARALASFFTSLVMWKKCTLKSNMGVIWTPNILYDLFGGRYLMCVPYANVIEFICSCSVVWFLWLRGLPSPQSDPVASLLEVSS